MTGDRGRPAPGTGPPPPASIGGVWSLAWPTMVAFALQSLVGLVDFVIVGALGFEAVAAVGVAHQIFFVQFAVQAAVTTGTVALVARSVGAGERDEADRVLRASVLVGALLGVAMLAVLPYAETLVAAFGVEAPVVARGGSYLRILLPFSAPFGVALVIAAGLRGAGDVRTPLWIGAVTNVLNVILNYGLVYGRLGMPELGTDGSALGSGIALTVGAVAYLWLWRRDLLVIRPRPWPEGLTREGFRRILRIGGPTAVEQLTWQAGLFLFLRVVAVFGTEPVTAYLIGVRILSFSFVPGLGFATAAGTLVGQHLGARRPDLAARSGWRANSSAMVVMGIAGLAIIAFSEPIAGWFGAIGERTVALTVTFILILGLAQPLMAVEFALGGALRGAGDTRFPLVAILTGLYAVRLGSALVVIGVFGGSVVAVWSCLLADYAVKAVMLAARFASGRWREIEV